MMPLHLTIQNFMNHKYGDIDFSLINSALIVGKTKDNDAISNGVGKSSLFSAIEWVLFNKVHKSTLDMIVRDGTKRCLVEFSFDMDGRHYKVSRSLSAKGTKNIYLYEKINDKWESITQRTPSETEDRLQKIIKITHKAFQYSVLFRQADLTGLTEMSDGKETSSKMRIDILKEPMNLTRYSKKEEIAVKKSRPIKKEIAKKESALEMLGDPEKDIKIFSDDLEKCMVQINEKETVINNELLIALEEKKKNLQNLRATFSASDADIHYKVEEQHNKVKKLNYSIKDLNNKRQDLLSSVKEQKELIDDKNNKIIELKSKLSQLEMETHRPVVKIKSEHTKTAASELKGSSLLTRAEVELEHAKTSIPNSDTCPSCEQTITPEYRQLFTNRVNKIVEEKKKDIDFYKKQLTKCKKRKEELSKELENAKKHKIDIENINTQKSSLEESIDVYNTNINKAEDDIRNVARQMDVQSAELQEAISYYNTLKETSERSDLVELNTKIFALSREIKVYEQSVESMRAEMQNLKTREGVLKDRIETRKKDKEKFTSLNDEIKKLRYKLDIYQRVINAFSHKGIPTFIINTCLNDLQFETNKALQQLRPDLEVSFDADLNFTYRRNGVERSYQQLSHGQHVYIALAFKRSLASVIQKKMDINIKFLEFDEVDAFLDNAGINALAHAIKQWHNDFKILVVTHNQSLKDKFSHAILVEEGDDGAETKIVTNW